MKRPLSSRFIAAAVLAVAAFGATSAAQARPDIQVSIGLPGLPVFVEPPVYVRSEPLSMCRRRRSCTSAPGGLRTGPTSSASGPGGMPSGNGTNGNAASGNTATTIGPGRTAAIGTERWTGPQAHWGRIPPMSLGIFLTCSAPLF
jgi:hypothetical protein